MRMPPRFSVQVIRPMVNPSVRLAAMCRVACGLVKVSAAPGARAWEPVLSPSAGCHGKRLVDVSAEPASRSAGQDASLDNCIYAIVYARLHIQNRYHDNRNVNHSTRPHVILVSL